MQEHIYDTVRGREELWERAMVWASRHDHFMIFSGNGVDYPMGGFPEMIMAGARRIVDLPGGKVFSALQTDRKEHPGWLCGYFGYDLKNETEKLSSKHSDFTSFPDACFFEPEHVLMFHPDRLEVISPLPVDSLIAEILKVKAAVNSRAEQGRLVRFPDRSNYIKTVDRIREHILDGDIYEMNYCVDFGAENVSADPLMLFKHLKQRSPTPFSTLAGFHDQFLICASPERFLRLRGDELLSQPIKGTARRGKDPEEDQQIREALLHSEKERAENLMIVDLVRNDLARSARTGTIKVPELFGIYTFRQLHQMISSVTATLSPETHPAEAIRNAFPMGSMTGAPKVKVMELIEKYETAKRGIYSGSAGFFHPSGDFDFNVVIRSMAYDHRRQRLSFWVGSAITYDSVAEQEFSECMLKARAILEVLHETGILQPGSLQEIY